MSSHQQNVFWNWPIFPKRRQTGERFISNLCQLGTMNISSQWNQVINQVIWTFVMTSHQERVDFWWFGSGRVTAVKRSSVTEDTSEVFFRLPSLCGPTLNTHSPPPPPSLSVSVCLCLSSQVSTQYTSQTAMSSLNRRSPGALWVNSQHYALYWLVECTRGNTDTKQLHTHTHTQIGHMKTHSHQGTQFIIQSDNNNSHHHV